MVATGDEFIAGFVMTFFVVRAKDAAPQSSIKPSARAPLMVMNLYFIQFSPSSIDLLMIFLLLRPRDSLALLSNHPRASQLPDDNKGKGHANRVVR